MEYSKIYNYYLKYEIKAYVFVYVINKNYKNKCMK
jgi:hypothetical protein